MTVTYQHDVTSSTSRGFTRLLFRWKGSLYKLIYREFFVFLTAFYIVSVLYRNVFTDQQKALFEKVIIYCDNFVQGIPISFILGFYVAYVANRWWQQYMALPWPDKIFEKVVIYCDAFIASIPISFILGFYVTYIANRWWEQYIAIPWPDKVMHALSLTIIGNDEYGRVLRRSMMRYLNLSLILVLRSISSAVKRRFPTMDHLVEAGFMTHDELELFQSVPNEEFNTYWIPCTWFIHLLKDAKKNKRLIDNQGLKLIMEEFNEFRSKCGMLWSYDWISIPLVYTQVVTLATYAFFLAALIGRQYIDSAGKVQSHSSKVQMEIDIYIPVFTILQFFFYMGLLKVAEQLINPFGDDDEDFELNWLIDRHTKVSYLGVDTLLTRVPPLVKDKYFDDSNLILPYTGASFTYKKKTYRGSVHDMQVPENQHQMFLPEIIEDDNIEPTIRSASKSSIPNIFTSSASAGIWRQSVGNIDIESAAQINETNNPAAEKIIKGSPFPGLKKLRTNYLIAKKEKTKDRLFLSPELPRWNSTSTMESFCSVAGDLNEMSETPSEILEGNETVENKPNLYKKNNETKINIEPEINKIVEPDKPGILIDSDQLSTSTKSNINLNARRGSTASTQWKGVRWKPLISTNQNSFASRRSSLNPATICSSCQKLTSNSDTLTDSQLGLRRFTMPSTSFDTLDKKSELPSLIPGYKTIPLDTSSAKSLPNIRVTDTNCDKTESRLENTQL